MIICIAKKDLQTGATNLLVRDAALETNRWRHIKANESWSALTEMDELHWILKKDNFFLCWMEMLGIQKGGWKKCIFLIFWGRWGQLGHSSTGGWGNRCLPEPTEKPVHQFEARQVNNAIFTKLWYYTLKRGWNELTLVLLYSGFPATLLYE